MTSSTNPQSTTTDTRTSKELMNNSKKIYVGVALASDRDDSTVLHFATTNIKKAIELMHSTYKSLEYYQKDYLVCVVYDASTGAELKEIGYDNIQEFEHSIKTVSSCFQDTTPVDTQYLEEDIKYIVVDEVRNRWPMCPALPVSTRGQVAIPKNVRHKLGIKAGDYVDLMVVRKCEKC
jgi:AbrB family looped-hinge helix DNA binding protein